MVSYVYEYDDETTDLSIQTEINHEILLSEILLIHRVSMSLVRSSQNELYAHFYISINDYIKTSIFQRIYLNTNNVCQQRKTFLKSTKNINVANFNARQQYMKELKKK
jgi:hypothetical protein